MPSQSRRSKELPVISFMKELSGKRIEQRRRRDHISQARMASGVGRSERWVRELEAGGPGPTLEDHVRCSHWLNLSTFHFTMPLLFVERHMPIPYELLAMEDLWDLEEACLALISERHMPIPYELLAMEDLWDLEEACLALISERQDAAKARLAQAGLTTGGWSKP